MNIIDPPQWRKSSRCGSNTCVEVARSSDVMFVRDSKDLAIAPLSFSKTEWSAFVDGVKAGEFDIA